MHRVEDVVKGTLATSTTLTLYFMGDDDDDDDGATLIRNAIFWVPQDDRSGGVTQRTDGPMDLASSFKSSLSRLHQRGGEGQRTKGIPARIARQRPGHNSPRSSSAGHRRRRRRWRGRLRRPRRNGSARVASKKGLLVASIARACEIISAISLCEQEEPFREGKKRGSTCKSSSIYVLFSTTSCPQPPTGKCILCR